jgi:hypothetical protein
VNRTAHTLPAKDVEALLSKLCIRLGFCLEPKARSRLAKFPPKTVERFVHTVIALEGLDPASISGELHKQIRRLVEEAFLRSEGDGP